MIELAIVMPFLLLMIMGVVDVGRMFYMTMALNGAARAGVQYGSQNPGTATDNPGMVQAAKDEGVNVVGNWWGTSTNFAASAAHFCQCENGTASNCTTGACPTKQFTLVKVDTSAEYHAFTFGAPKTIVLKGQAIMKVLNN
jgi:Flp pilus assembly protein TadG